MAFCSTNSSPAPTARVSALAEFCGALNASIFSLPGPELSRLALGFSAAAPAPRRARPILRRRGSSCHQACGDPRSQAARAFFGREGTPQRKPPSAAWRFWRSPDASVFAAQQASFSIARRCLKATVASLSARSTEISVLRALDSSARAFFCAGALVARKKALRSCRASFNRCASSDSDKTKSIHSAQDKRDFLDFFVGFGSIKEPSMRSEPKSLGRLRGRVKKRGAKALLRRRAALA